MRRSSRAAALSVRALLFASGLAVAAPAQSSLSIGVGGPAAQSGLNSQRQNRSDHAFPRHPVVLWKAHIGGVLSQAPAIDPDGNIVAITDASVVTQLDSRGRVQWQQPLPSAHASAPIITADGHRLIVLRDGIAQRYNASGHALWSARTGSTRNQRSASPLALKDGRFLTPRGAFISSWSHYGEEDGRARFPSTVSALAEYRGRIAVTLTNGDLFLWHPPRPPKRVGSFGSASTSELVIFRDQAVAIVSANSLVSIDLRSGRRAELARADEKDPLVGTPAITADGTIHTLSLMSQLIQTLPTGEAGGTRFIPQATTLPPARFPPRLPSPIVDKHGTVAVAWPGTPTAFLRADDTVESAPAAVCATPLALLPSGPESLVLVCSSGLMWGIGATNTQQIPANAAAYTISTPRH